MQDKVQKRLIAYLKRREVVTDDEMYLHILMLVANVFAGLMHLVLLGLALGFSTGVLILLNCVSLLIYSLNFLSIRRRKYLRAGLTLTLEVVAYTIFSIVYIGPNNYSILYFILVMVMQIIIPYGKVQIRVAVILLLWAASAAVAAFGGRIAPMYDVGVTHEAVLKNFNFNASVIGIILEISIGNMIRNIISATTKERVRTYENQAHTDQLTGLFNRRYADLVFARLIAEREESPEKQWCVAMLDIDDFKRINDTHGHAVGDEVLVFLARFLEDNLRKDDIVFRWGGEEFLILLESISCELGARVLDKIRAKLATTPIYTSAGRMMVTATIGAADIAAPDVVGCIARADARMYEGKQTGKNKVVSE